MTGILTRKKFQPGEELHPEEVFQPSRELLPGEVFQPDSEPHSGKVIQPGGELHLVEGGIYHSVNCKNILSIEIRIFSCVYN